MTDWSRISSAFEKDGSLRDIYILDTSLAEWEKTWAFLLGRRASLTLRVGGEPVPLPSHAEQIFVARDRGDTATLSCLLGGATLNCHFFVKEEVEFDVDPAEVEDARAANEVARFMVGLSKATGREILLTAENNRDGVVAKVEPGDKDVRWHPL